MLNLRPQPALRLLVCWCVCLMAASLCAQSTGQHYEHAGALPPGAIGSRQLLRGGPLPGYFQPVEVRAPKGSEVSLAIDGQFTDGQATPFKVGMLIAPVYRLRVINIPDQPGAEVFPTIELVNRLYPPVGEEFRFSVPIEIAQQDLLMAIEGKFVTRVIYLENPRNALPSAQGADDTQQYFEIRPTEDPLAVADRLGRPMAILRMGGRLPEASGPDEKFMFGSPMMLVPRSLPLWGGVPAGGEPLTPDGMVMAKRARGFSPTADNPEPQPAITRSVVERMLAGRQSNYQHDQASISNVPPLLMIDGAGVDRPIPTITKPTSLTPPTPIVPGPLSRSMGGKKPLEEKKRISSQAVASDEG